MKILITGGCGFLGSNIAYGLKDKGYEIHLLDNMSRNGAEQNLQWLQENISLQFHHIDIRDAQKVEDTIAAIKPGAIFHLAGQVAMTTSIKNPRLDFETNTLGSMNVLEGVRKHSPDTVVIYSSTNKVYGDLERYSFEEKEKRYAVSERPMGFNELEPLDFHSPYGCSKGAADQYMLDYARIYGLKTIVFRHSTIYGGRQYATFDQGWIGWFCQQAMIQKGNPEAEPYTIAGNGKQVRDVLHAADAMRLYISCIEHADKLCGNAYNIGGGMHNSLSLLELFDLLGNQLGITLKYTQLPPRESDQKLFVADISKISSRTGWQPEVDKATGVKLMLEWLKSL